MASTLRFDNWEDSNGTPIFDINIYSFNDVTSYEVNFSSSGSLISLNTLIGDNLTISGINYAPGVSKTIKIYNSSSTTQSIFVPNDWKFVSPGPGIMEPQKTFLLSLTCFGNTASECIASWAAEY